MPGTIDHWSKTPIYQQLAEIIRSDISNGTYGPGDRLPSEIHLQQQHGIARDTARDAYRVLEDEGLVIALAGRGRFVVPESDSDQG
jgi:DNA-binding GntR family transcriptional regulator